MSQTISALMGQIRDLVNNSWKNYELRQNEAQFSQLASALDTIEDTEEAILAFATEEVRESIGVMYLVTYGLLQAFFLQQDAVKHLCEVLNIPDSPENYPKLEAIREIRNNSTGHPTQRRGKKDQPISYHQISRITMCKKGFQLLSHDSDGNRQFRDISIPSLVADQNTIVSEMLTRILEILKAEHAAHKGKYRMTKLINMFPTTIGYAFEKAGQPLYDPSHPIGIAEWGITEIKTAVHAFFDAVKQRDMEAYTNLQHDLKYIDHAFTRYARILESKKNGTTQAEDEYDGQIYLVFLRKQVEELRECAKQIDEDYDS